MFFYSTNKKSPLVDFPTALFAGLAPDGGLYMPEKIPHFSPKERAALVGLSLPEVGLHVLQKWIDDIPEPQLKKIVTQSLRFPLPLQQVGEHTILELFHGPTKAFKDVAAGVLAQLFEYYLERDKKTLTILVATSGDTGGAIAQAFSDLKRVKVVILYPAGRVSALQEEQLTRVGANVRTLAVAGDFDACQSYVKQAFLDPDLAHLSLSSANSINIGRLLPQIIYYVWTYAQLPKEQLQFIIPSGNMGNVTAGLFAAKMGLPLSFVIATNENDVAVKYYQTGTFNKQKTRQTLSTAMDIGNPSNFVRLLALFQYDHQAFCKKIEAVKVTDQETIATIKHISQANKYLLDFHTAVAVTAATHRKHNRGRPIIIATAAPMKFASEIQQATDIVLDDSAEIKRLQKFPKRVTNVANSYQAIKKSLTQS